MFTGKWVQMAYIFNISGIGLMRHTFADDVLIRRISSEQIFYLIILKNKYPKWN